MSANSTNEFAASVLDDNQPCCENCGAAIRPFVPCSDQGVWVEPRLTCRILFEDWSTKNTLQNPEFAELLAEL